MTTVVALVVCAVVLLVTVPAWWRFLRRRAERGASAGNDRATRVHRLRRLQLSAGLASLALAWGYAAGTLGWVAQTLRPRLHHGAAPAPAVVAELAAAGLLALAGLVAFPLALRRSVRPVYARVRDADPRPLGSRRRRLVAGLVMILVYGGIAAAAGALTPRHGAGRVVATGAAWVVILLVGSTLAAPLVCYLLGSTPLPDPARHRLTALADRMGVRLRDIRVFPARGQRIANALQVGALPGLRYVLVSDYLLDHLTDEEVDAVAAHEFGHARGRHVLAKMAAVLAVLVAFLAAGAALAGRARGSAGEALALAALPVAYVIGSVTVQGLVGIRLERRADARAVEAVGAPAVAGALEKLTRLNDLTRRTGRTWSLLTQHPGLEDRLARLRSADAPYPGRAGAGRRASSAADARSARSG